MDGSDALLIRDFCFLTDLRRVGIDIDLETLLAMYGLEID